MKTFTEAEKTIARNIDSEYKWMARDQDGNLCIYEEKPEKEENSWYSGDYDYISYYISYFNHLFPAIKWEDEEPTLISEIYNPQILSYAEREYLKMILKPFNNKAESVTKIVETNPDKDWRGKEYLLIVLYGKGLIDTPDFEAGEMYKGMELGKKYTLDELGITF